MTRESKVASGGGLRAILYTFKKAREAGGVMKMYRSLRTRNACKTCALGMGGQKGGMVNERGSFPEVCKKSLQAMAADMQPAITDTFWQKNSISHLRSMSPRMLESSGRLDRPVFRAANESKYTPIRWSEAFTRLSDKLRASNPGRDILVLQR